MSDYTEGSMRAIVCASGITLAGEIFWHTCKIAVLTCTYCFQRVMCCQCHGVLSKLKPQQLHLSEKSFCNSGGALPSPKLPLSFRLQNCNLTSASCATLRSVLSVQPSLTELHIGDNKLGTAGVKVLCQGMMNPNCKLQKLQ